MLKDEVAEYAETGGDMRLRSGLRSGASLAVAGLALSALVLAWPAPPTSAQATATVERRGQSSGAIARPLGTHTENGLAGYAKILCSGVFVSGRAPEDVADGSAYFFMPRAEQDRVRWTIDRDARLARAALGGIARQARYHDDQGCIIENPDRPGLHF